MSSASERFEIKRAGWSTALLALFGATASRSYVTVDQTTLFARFGFYSISIPLESASFVERAIWQWYRGLGWRTNLHSSIALIGASEGVVHLRLSEPLSTRILLIPIRLTDFYVSVEDPNGLVAAMQASIINGAQRGFR